MMRPLEIVVALCVAAGSTSVAQADDRWSRYAEPFTPDWAVPVLDVYPQGGPPGTQIEIVGSKFHRSVQVFLGDQPIPIVELGRRHIIAVIPRFARGDDFIYVVDATGRARTAVPFDVVRRW
jgi:hypothetical protein